MTGSGGGTLGLDLACDRPGEGRHLAGDRRGDQVRVLAGGHEPPEAGREPEPRAPGARGAARVRLLAGAHGPREAGTEPELRLPGDRPHPFRHIVQASLDQTRDARREAVAPGPLDQNAAGPARARPAVAPARALGTPRRLRA